MIFWFISEIERGKVHMPPSLVNTVKQTTASYNKLQKILRYPNTN